MLDNEDVRIVDGYTIFDSFQIGQAEILLGENLKAAPGEKYMCCTVSYSKYSANFSDAEVSDDYIKIIQVYTKLISKCVDLFREELAEIKKTGIDDAPVKEDGYIPVSYEDDLHNRVIVIKPEVLKREYQRATKQYRLCTGGFGASPNSRGSAWFCTNLYDGHEGRFERQDVLGIVNEEQMPDWVKEGLERFTKQRHKDRGAR